MRKGQFLFIILASALIITACGRGGQPAPASGVYDLPIEIPDEYTDKANPLVGSDRSIEAGKQIFLTNCASCHGESGAGDGPASVSLDPPPLDLAERQKELSDGYLYWRIAEGGMMSPFNSVMPPWENVFTEEQV